MKISLVLCPNWGTETPHMGIALLAANLRRHSHDVRVFDLNIRVQRGIQGNRDIWKTEDVRQWSKADFTADFIVEKNATMDIFVEEILASDAHIIGFSIYNSTYFTSLELARRIKKKDSSKIIIFGGQFCYPKINAETLARYECVDIVVIGEGEDVLIEIINKLEATEKIDFCAGIIFKDNGNLVSCGLREPIANLDDLPFADFSDFTLSMYDNPSQLPIFLSRGCPYACVFCSTKLFWMRYRAMSGERVFKEIEYRMDRYKDVHFFTFNDHVMNADMRNLSVLCDLIIDAKSKRKQNNPNWEKVGWSGAAVLRDGMTTDFLKKMKDAGCVELEYGAESGSTRVRKLMKKSPYEIDILEQVIRDTYAVGIGARVNFMFGFPGETEEDFQETLTFLKRNKDYFSQVHPSESFCCIDQGTYLFERPEEFGVIDKHSSLFWSTSDGKNTYPERLRRHQVFCELAESLNIPLSPGASRIKQHKDDLLLEYDSYLISRKRQ